MLLGAEAESFNPLSVETGLYVWTTIAFLVVLYFLAKKVFPKLQEGLADREQAIKGQLEEAEAARQEAEKLREEVKAQLANVREQANRMSADIRQAAEASAKEILARAEQETRGVTDKALKELEAERERMVNDLRPRVGEWAVQIASKIVEKELDENAHRALIDRFVNELSSEGAPSQ